MEMEGWELFIMVGFFGVLFFIFGGVLGEKLTEAKLGGMICREQYGEDAEFVAYDWVDAIVECELPPEARAFDGARTRLIP